jgi:hypothetical protein
MQMRMIFRKIKKIRVKADFQGLDHIFAFAGEKILICRFFIFLLVGSEVECGANDFYYKIEESEGERNENSCFWGACRAGKPTDNYCKIEHDKNKMHGELGKIRLDEFYIQHKVAKGIYRGKEKYAPKILCIENLASVRESHRQQRVEHNDDKREIKARMTEKAFEF